MDLKSAPTWAGLGGVIGIANNQTQVVVFSSSDNSNTVEDIAATINGFKQSNPEGKVIMVGHSLGAENVVELAEDHKNITVDLFIAVDAHDLTLQPTTSTIPSNVKNVINYYQREDKRGILGQVYTAEEEKTTTGINKEVKGTGGHTGIDNSLSETIKKDIFNFTQGKDAVKKQEIDLHYLKTRLKMKHLINNNSYLLLYSVVIIFLIISTTDYFLQFLHIKLVYAIAGVCLIGILYFISGTLFRINSINSRLLNIIGIVLLLLVIFIMKMSFVKYMSM